MTVRWAILGCGDIAQKRVASAICSDPNATLVAACRRSKDKLHDFGEQFNIPKKVTDAADLFADPEIDAIYVATPVALHCENTLAAARAGKHVLVEKPMAMSVDECDRMVDGCREAKVKLGVAYYRRFYPVVERIQKLLSSGEIGTPMSVDVMAGNGFQLQPGDPGYWRVVAEEGGGGPLMDIGSHRINLMLDLFGQIKTVKAFCATHHPDYEVEDCATLLLEFESNVHGVLRCFFGTTNVPDHFSIIGSKGRLVVNNLNSGDLTIERGRETRNELHPPAANLHGPLVEDFSRAILENREPRVGGLEGRATNVVMTAAYRDATC